MKKLWAWLLAASLLLAVGVGCSVTPYRVEVFPEMHYQESYRSQEPPRLYPPPDSVPITGKELRYTFEEASRLTNPMASTGENMAEGARLYKINCAMCHGPQGRGDGPIASYFQKAQVPPPMDFTSPRARFRNDGQLFWLMSYSFGQMPPFRNLLTEDERWQIVLFIHSLQGQ